MSDAWSTAVSEAEAELSGEAAEVSSATTTVAAPVETSTPAPADTSSETVESAEPTTEVAPPAVEETPWWDGLYDQEPTPDELKKGTLRQRDYTQKTQQLAQYREAANWALEKQAALRADPVAALKQMAVELGLLDRDQEEFRPDEIDPALERVAALERRLQEAEQREVMSQVRAEIQDVKSRYSDFDEEAVLGLAAEFGNRGVGLSVEEAYLLWRGQSASEREAAEARARAKAEAEAARATAAAAQEGRLASGHNPAATEQEPQFDTFEEMFNDAWEKAGGT